MALDVFSTKPPTNDDVVSPSGTMSASAGWVDRYRTLANVAVHAVIFAIALLVAFALAYNFHRFGKWFTELYLPLLVLALPIKLLVFGWERQYRGTWRYAGMYDVLGIIRASHISAFIFIGAFFLVENLWDRWFGHRLIDRDLENRLRQSVFLLDWAGTIGLVSLVRVGARLYVEEVHAEPFEKHSRAIIVGAGNAGEAVLRELLRMPTQRHQVVGFLDDRPGQLNRTIHGVEVLGTLDQAGEICEQHLVDELLIALPNPTPKEIRRVIEICEGSHLRFRMMPGVADLIAGRLHVTHLRDVHIEDLLGRAPVQLDSDAIARELKGQSVVVTGAGGSIGAEMCRQAARFAPNTLVLVEQAENNLFEIDRELKKSFPEVTVIPYVADICDAARMRWIFQRQKPTVLFHAAAHKHVPMMEWNPGEAVKNNVLGTQTVADLAADHGVAKMVLISTDKAVNPTSVMGCTKRVAELYVQHLSARTGTQFITVRFGNVLGSSGSVVPIFQEQIAAGGPVTVTHPEMVRYFMTIPEAAQLVLQAGAMGSGGEIYVLDMGEPVKIVDLARDMITLSGLRPGRDIEVVFTGLRPGEKLFEELSIEGEDVARTGHPKIGIWKHKPGDFEQICRGIDELIKLSLADDVDAIRRSLRALVPEFSQSPTLAESV